MCPGSFVADVNCAKEIIMESACGISNANVLMKTVLTTFLLTQSSFVVNTLKALICECLGHGFRLV